MMNAIMTLVEGESIFGGYATPPIPGTGFYKLLIKKKVNGKFEWAHFVERVTGSKDSVVRGELEYETQVKTLVDALNRALQQTFGPHIFLVPSEYEFKGLMGNKFDETQN